MSQNSPEIFGAFLTHQSGLSISNAPPMKSGPWVEVGHMVLSNLRDHWLLVPEGLVGELDALLALQVRLAVQVGSLDEALTAMKITAGGGAR